MILLIHQIIPSQNNFEEFLNEFENLKRIMLHFYSAVVFLSHRPSSSYFSSSFKTHISSYGKVWGQLWPVVLYNSKKEQNCGDFSLLEHCTAAR